MSDPAAVPCTPAVLLAFLILQRLGRLIREGRIVEALKLGLSIYDGTAPAVIGKWVVTLPVH